MLDVSEEIYLVDKLIKDKFPKKNSNKFILINLSTQQLILIDNLKRTNLYGISSSKFGIGNLNNSYQTPLGLHTVNNKIGKDHPINTIFKGRKVVKGGITTRDLTKPEFRKSLFRLSEAPKTKRVPSGFQRVPTKPESSKLERNHPRDF